MQTLLTYAKHTGMDVKATPQSIESQATPLNRNPVANTLSEPEGAVTVTCAHTVTSNSVPAWPAHGKPKVHTTRSSRDCIFKRKRVNKLKSL